MVVGLAFTALFTGLLGWVWGSDWRYAATGTIVFLVVMVFKASKNLNEINKVHVQDSCYERKPR